jgi:predicted enzyme related to lactoylglutathione lyase
MFTTKQAVGGFTVDDIEQAKEFYGQTLGIDVEEGEMGILTLNVGVDNHVIIYPKPDHRPAGYTTLNLVVDDVDAAADELIERGVTFERYPEIPATPNAKGVYKGNGPTIAWFKDPAGNVLSLIED